MKKIFFLMSLAFLAISCTDQPDYVMSLTESEQLEVMQGTWKLTRASNSSAVYDENDELHLQNDLETGLNTLEITENSVVMHFDEPISLYAADEMGAGWELVRTDDTFEFPTMCSRYLILLLPQWRVGKSWYQALQKAYSSSIQRMTTHQTG